jgi:hypothetical protein
MGIAGGTQIHRRLIIVNMVFESMESFEHSFGANAEKIMADLPNFTNVQPQVQISELYK